MNDVDSRLRQLVAEMTDSAPPAGPVPMTTPVAVLRRRPRRRMAVAVVAAAAVLVGGVVVWRLVDSDTSTITADVAGDGSGAAGAELPSPDALANLDDQQWPYPTFLPDGVKFDLAMRTAEGGRSLFFVGDDESTVLTVTIGTFSPEILGGTSTERAIGGVTWLGPQDGTFLHETSSGWVAVSGSGIEEGDVVAAIASLIVVDDLGLPRRPVDLKNGPFVEVARATQGGAEVILDITTDGLYYGNRTRDGFGGSGRGCCSVLKEGDLVNISGGTGPGPTRAGDIPSGEGLIEGVADESVAAVEIRLVDGSIITTEPQDTNDSFPVNFVFVAVPVVGDDLFGNVDQFVAFDVDGNELGRLSGGTGIIKANSATTPAADLGEASSFRLDLVNQTGVAYLSLTDYMAIRAAACGGAVNDPDELVNLADTWRLGALSGSENAANALWLAARQVCPDAFDADNLAAGPPFGIGGGGGFAAPVPERLDGLPDGFPEFVDLSVLDDSMVSWVPDEQVLVFSPTSLGEGEAVAYFRDGFPDGWTVNEVLGPLVDANGFREWSLDVEGFGWDGVVTVLTGDFGTGDETSVSIVFAHD